VTGNKPPPPIPPLMVPLAELAQWLRKIHGLSEEEIGGVVVYLRGNPTHFRLDGQIPESWDDLEVEDWGTGRARWKQDPAGIYYPLEVSWFWVEDAITGALARRERRLALRGVTGDGGADDARPWVRLRDAPGWFVRAYGSGDGDATLGRDLLSEVQEHPAYFRLRVSAPDGVVPDETKSLDISLKHFPEVDWATCDWGGGNSADEERLRFPLEVWRRVVADFAEQRRVRLESKRRRLERLALQAPAPEPPSQPIGRNLGGRPPKWDWTAFAKEMIRLAQTPDGLGDRAAVTEHMKKWCMYKWGDEPADSVLRAKVGDLYPDPK
jgi:hypothetical protein